MLTLLSSKGASLFIDSGQYNADAYWSSNEAGDNIAWKMTIQNGNSIEGDFKDDYFNNYVRPVIKF